MGRPHLQLPHGKLKGYQVSLKEGTFRWPFHQTKLAVHDIIQGKKNALASLNVASLRGINLADRAQQSPSHLHHSCK